MSRRAPRRKTHGQPEPHAQTGTFSRAIVLVDGTRIRRKIKKGYEKARLDLENSRQQLDQFHLTDLPQFTRWLNSHFGAMLTELRELSQQLAADEQLIFEVENEVMFGAGSFARAYRRVMDYRENPQPPPPPPTGSDEWDREEAGSSGRPESEDSDREEDSFEAFLNELFDDMGPGEGTRNARVPRAGQPEARGELEHKAARLKDLYRAVVRRLHPDRQPEMTAQKIEWWHQAQAANQAGDVEQLEVILTLCEIEDNGTTAHTSASLLQRITAQLKSSLREIKRQLAGRRKDPAWNFSQRTNRDALEAEMRHALKDDLERMRYQSRRNQDLIASWKTAAARLKRPRRRKQSLSETDCFF